MIPKLLRLASVCPNSFAINNYIHNQTADAGTAMPLLNSLSLGVCVCVCLPKG
jgi:hypothetical protein